MNISRNGSVTISRSWKYKARYIGENAFGIQIFQEGKTGESDEMESLIEEFLETPHAKLSLWPNGEGLLIFRKDYRVTFRIEEGLVYNYFQRSHPKLPERFKTMFNKEVKNK